MLQYAAVLLVVSAMFCQAAKAMSELLLQLRSASAPEREEMLHQEDAKGAQKLSFSTDTHGVGYVGLEKAEGMHANP